MLRCGLTKSRVQMIFATRDTAHLPQLRCFRQWTEGKFLFPSGSYCQFILAVADVLESLAVPEILQSNG